MDRCTPDRSTPDTVGELMIRLMRERRQAETDRPSYRDRALAEPSVTAYPRLTSVAGQRAELTSCDTHPAGLEAVIDGLLARA